VNVGGFILLLLAFAASRTIAAQSTGEYVYGLLVAADATAEARFGHAIALLDSIVFVGAPLVEDETGAVYVFRLDASGEWVQTQRIQASDATPGSRFGWSLSARGDSLLIGAPDAPDEQGVPVGAAYLFAWSADEQWHEVEQIALDDRGEGSEFGRSVSLRNGGPDPEPFGPDDWVALIGAPGASNAEGTATGAVYW